MSPAKRQSAKNARGILSNRPLVVSVVLLMLMAGVLLVTRNSASEDTTTGNDSASVSKQTIPPAAKEAEQNLRLPDGWEKIVLKNDRHTPGFILRAKHDDPEASAVITLYEGKLEKNFKIESVPEPLVEGFRRKIDNFQLVNRGITKAGGYEVVKIRYTQRARKGTAVLENLHVVMPAPNATYYFNFQAAKGGYQEVEDEFDRILEDFAKSVRNA